MDGRGRLDASVAALNAAIEDMPAPSLADTDAEVRDYVRALYALGAKLQARSLPFLTALDSRPDAVPDARADRVSATFLRYAVRTSRAQAYRDVKVAAAVGEDGPLPHLGAAFAAGEVTRAHLDAVVPAVNKLPKQLLATVDAEGVTVAQRVDELLAEQCRCLAPEEIEQVLPQLLATLDPHGQDGFDEHRYERREFHAHTDPSGMLVGGFQLDPVGGATLKAAIDRYAAPEPARNVTDADGVVVEIRDLRTRSQRAADAIVEIARVALGLARDEADGGTPAAPRRGGRAPAHVAVVATVDQLAALVGGPPAGLARCEQTGPIPGPVLARLICDGVLHRVLTTASGAVLDVGHATRYASAAQRKALAVRDGGCVVPGCRLPVALCDIHHVVSWSHGGRTDLSNLVPLCDRHHTAVHAGVWRIEIRNGLPWVIPPHYVDPFRRALRNSLPAATQAAIDLGRQLTAPSDGTQADHEPSRPPPDPPAQGPGPAGDAPPRDAPPRDAPPRDAPPRDAPPRDAPPRDAPPRDAHGP